MIVFDEKEYAQSIEKKGFKTEKRRYYELGILIKYWIYCGYDEGEVRKKALKYCNKFMSGFDINENYNQFNRTIRFAYRKALITDRVVNITKNELDIIDNLDTVYQKKLAFVLLVIYKFYGSKKFKVTLHDIFSLAEIKHDLNYKNKFLHELTSKKLINIDTNGSRIVNFANNSSEIVIIIRNFENLILYYEKWNGNNKIKTCEECENSLIRIKGKNSKMCKKCAEKSKKESWKNATKKYKSKSHNF